MLVMQEEEGYNFTAAVKTEAPYPLNYAFCGPPISGNVRGEVIREWLIYHLYMYTYQGTKAHFFFYDVGGLGQEDRQLLQPFVEAGFLTIWDVIDSFRYPAWYHSQVRPFQGHIPYVQFRDVNGHGSPGFDEQLA